MTGRSKITIGACVGLLCCATANAFVPAAQTTMTTTSLNAMRSFNDEVVDNSNLPGNFGFDPLHLAQTQEQLITYRKAEMKHARLAILAVMAMLWSDYHVVDTVGASPFFEGRAFPEFLGACIGLPAALELYGERVEEEHADDATYFPGQLDLDPFHLYPASTLGQQRMQFLEIMAGRVCMLAAASRLTENFLVAMGLLGEEDSLVSLLMPVQTTVEQTMEQAIV